jgi:anaerobic sulfite reductase subunit C
MDENGVIPGRVDGRVTLRVRSLEPYTSEMTAEQIGVIADIAEQYGSGSVHITPRQTVEIPHIEAEHLKDIMPTLSACGLSEGATGNYLRNVTACSRWCLYNVSDMSAMAQRLNALHNEKQLPAKTDISLSGCDFSCVRSRISDIGVIARTEVALSDRKCKQCSLCVREPLGCQVDAITLTDEGVSIDQQKCVRCGFCSNVCRPGTIEVKSRGFDIFVGGKGGLRPREAELFGSAETEEQASGLIGSLLARYAAIANDGERLGDILDRCGIEELNA